MAKATQLNLWSNLSMRASLLDFAMHTEADNADQQHMFWVVDTAAISVATGNDLTNETVMHVTVTSKVCFFFRSVYSAG
jgi:hypothetical protein